MVTRKGTTYTPTEEDEDKQHGTNKLDDTSFTTDASGNMTDNGEDSLKGSPTKDRDNEGDDDEDELVKKDIKVGHDDDMKNTIETSSKYFHYAVFQILFITGFMIHCRPYFDTNLKVSIGLLASHLALPTIHNRILQEITFLTFITYVIYSTIKTSPHNANHHNVCGIMSCLLLPTQFRRVMRFKNDNIETVTDNTLNVMRWAVVILYFMAGFHKINEDFLFNPKVSCAYDMLWKYFEVIGMTEYDSVKLTWWLQPLPFVGLFVEIAPPIMLLFQSTQKFAVLMLISLHWLLLPVGFADFGSIAQSFLWLFVTVKISDKPMPFQYYADMAGCFVFLEIIAFIYYSYHDDDDYGLKGPEAAMVFVVYAMHWLNIFRTKSLDDGVKMKRPKSLISLLALFAFLFFSFNQYLGLRTTGTLTMFSNLRTEGPTSNHLLLRSNPIKFWGYQEDVVSVIDLDDRFTEIEDNYKYQMKVMSRVLRREQKWQERDVYLKVEYKGQIYETHDLNFDPAFDIFREEESWLSHKYFDFRDIQASGPQECEW